MNNCIRKSWAICFLILAFPLLNYSQDQEDFEMSYEVNKIFPAVSISSDNLLLAKEIKDLNKHFKKSWIKKYLYVEVKTQEKGVQKSARAKSDQLSEEQKELMNAADLGSEIVVSVNYIPNNSLKHNDPKVFDFSFSVDPKNDAQFLGGQEALKKYLAKNIQEKIATDKFKQYGLAVVKFTVNSDGQIINPHLFWESSDEENNVILLASICNMPKWLPAEHANSYKVDQDFALIVGDKESCAINTINIDPNKFN